MVQNQAVITKLEKKNSLSRI